MSQSTRREVGANSDGSSSRKTPESADTDLEGRSVVGVDDQELQRNPNKFRGEVLKGPHFRSANFPDAAPAGGEIEITGEIHFDNWGSIVSTSEIRVMVDSPSLNEPIYQSVGKLSHCQSRTFNISIPVPPEVGSTMAVTVTGQRKVGFPTGWATGKSEGPARIDILSQEDYAAREATSYLPTAAIGAGVGLALSEVTGGNRAAYAAAGGAAGVGAAASGFGLGGGSGGSGGGGGLFSSLPIPGPTGIALGGLGLAGAAVFIQSTGADEVLRPAADAASGAIQTGTAAARRANLRERLNPVSGSGSGSANGSSGQTASN